MPVSELREHLNPTRTSTGTSLPVNSCRSGKRSFKVPGALSFRSKKNIMIPTANIVDPGLKMDWEPSVESRMIEDIAISTKNPSRIHGMLRSSALALRYRRSRTWLRTGAQADWQIRAVSTGARGQRCDPCFKQNLVKAMDANSAPLLCSRLSNNMSQNGPGKLACLAALACWSVRSEAEVAPAYIYLYVMESGRPQTP